MVLRSLVAGLALAVAAGANPLVGSWAAPQGTPTLTVRTDGTLTWNGQPFRYQLQGNLLVYQGAEGAGMAQFQVQGDQLVLAGQEIGMVQLRRVAAAPPSPSAPAAPVATGKPPETPAPSTPAPPEAPAASPGPNDFVARPYGFRMTVAPGWKGRSTDEAVVFGHDSKPGAVILTITDEEVTEADVQKVARDGYREEGVDLTPVTPGKYARVPTGQGLGFYLRVKGTMQGKPVAGFAGAYLPPKGQAILVLALTAPEKVSDMEGDARSMLSSVRLSEAVSPALRKWDQELRGMRVQYMWSYSSSSPGGASVGGSQNKDWHLCRDGTYWYRGRSNVSVDSGTMTGVGGTPSGAWASGYSHKGASEWGRWEVVSDGAQQAAIVFRPVGSGAYRYPLSKQRKRGTSFMQKHFGDMGVYAAEAADCR